MDSPGLRIFKRILESSWWIAASIPPHFENVWPSRAVSRLLERWEATGAATFFPTKCSLIFVRGLSRSWAVSGLVVREKEENMFMMEEEEGWLEESGVS